MTCIRFHNPTTQSYINFYKTPEEPNFKTPRSEFEEFVKSNNSDRAHFVLDMSQGKLSFANNLGEYAPNQLKTGHVYIQIVETYQDLGKNIPDLPENTLYIQATRNYYTTRIAYKKDNLIWTDLTAFTYGATNYARPTIPTSTGNFAPRRSLQNSDEDMIRRIFDSFEAYSTTKNEESLLSNITSDYSHCFVIDPERENKYIFEAYKKYLEDNKEKINIRLLGRIIKRLNKNYDDDFGEVLYVGPNFNELLVSQKADIQAEEMFEFFKDIKEVSENCRKGENFTTRELKEFFENVKIWMTKENYQKFAENFKNNEKVYQRLLEIYDDSKDVISEPQEDKTVEQRYLEALERHVEENNTLKTSSQENGFESTFNYIEKNKTTIKIADIFAIIKEEGPYKTEEIYELLNIDYANFKFDENSFKALLEENDKKEEEMRDAFIRSREESEEDHPLNLILATLENTSDKVDIFSTLYQSNLEYTDEDDVRSVAESIITYNKSESKDLIDLTLSLYIFMHISEDIPLIAECINKIIAEKESYPKNTKKFFSDLDTPCTIEEAMGLFGTANDLIQFNNLLDTTSFTEDDYYDLIELYSKIIVPYIEDEEITNPEGFLELITDNYRISDKKMKNKLFKILFEKI